MKFNCEVRVLRPSLVLVRLTGVLDAGSSSELEAALGRHLRDPKVMKIVLEVPALTFISSSGLRVIMVMIKSLVPRNGKLYMVGAAAQIVGLIKMSGMSKWIHQRENLIDCENERDV